MNASEHKAQTIPSLSSQEHNFPGEVYEQV